MVELSCFLNTMHVQTLKPKDHKRETPTFPDKIPHNPQVCWKIVKLLYV